MRFVSSVLLALLILTPGARASDLTKAEIKHLDQQFGIRQDGQMFKDMSTEERDKIHTILNDPFPGDYPSTRDAEVMSVLLGVYERQCRTWALVHLWPQCPPAGDSRVEPGKEIADSQCNACHLLGVANAPGFFRLARQGGLDARKIGTALESGHRMSPIHLSGDQLNQLSLYIDSLR